MKKWCAIIEQNGGEYYGSVTFFAHKAELKKGNERCLVVDGRIMEFDEKVDELTEEIEE